MTLCVGGAFSMISWVTMTSAKDSARPAALLAITPYLPVSSGSTNIGRITIINHFTLLTTPNILATRLLHCSQHKMFWHATAMPILLYPQYRRIPDNIFLDQENPVIQGLNRSEVKIPWLMTRICRVPSDLRVTWSSAMRGCPSFVHCTEGVGVPVTSISMCNRSLTPTTAGCSLFEITGGNCVSVQTKEFCYYNTDDYTTVSSKHEKKICLHTPALGLICTL